MAKEPPTAAVLEHVDGGATLGGGRPPSCSKTAESELGGSLESALHNQLHFPRTSRGWPDRPFCDIPRWM